MMEDNNAGKITWSFIWRVIVLYILIGFVLSFILGLILGFNNTSFLSITATISSAKKIMVGSLFINIISVILACKFATSDIKRKFIIDSNNIYVILKNITTFLIVIAIIYGLYIGITLTNDTADYEENLRQLSVDASEYYSTIGVGTTIEEDIESFISFSNTMTVISVICNIGVILLMIPFERKLLNS